ncbi:MAG: methyltransferase domain-containing protein [Solirubrobacteraceae bacterium]
MRARLDCQGMYAAEEDPWGIGEADSARYDLYVDSIKARVCARGSVLDVGCGFGSMLARLRSDFDRLHGIELSADAIADGVERYPFISFEQGSIDALERTDADRQRFDAIIFSDVIYYVDEAGRRTSLRWIAEHLNRDGFAFVAAYSPGGREYTTPQELRTLVEREFVIEQAELLDSEHLMLLARPRRRLAALTLDYETWQPIPAGRRIDWDADVFAPTDALLDACDAEGARLTIFAELGEHAYLREHEPQLAARMEAQWRDAIQRGHDVQMHLHPNWLPELGAHPEAGRYRWNELLTRADDHPDLVGLIGRLKQTLEQAIKPVDPSYEAVAFRAGGYEAQPFRRVAEALRANDMLCDSSVYHGGGEPGTYHDYSRPFDTHQPWFASRADPQLNAPPAERGIVELPVATFRRNDRWTFDMAEGGRFGDRLLARIEAERTAGPSTETARAIAKARGVAGFAYGLVGRRRRAINRLLPRQAADALVAYPRQRPVEDDFYVAVGHSKGDLDIAAIRDQLGALREAGVEIVRLADMARIAREQLERTLTLEAAGELREQDLGLRRRAGHDEAQSHRLQAMIPLDRTRVLDLGDFAAADLCSLPFADGTFDCVYAENSLTSALDVDATLSEVRRALADGGLLVAAIRPDATDTRRISVEHTWKTTAADVEERLRHAGFIDVSIEETDTYRLGAAPYPPSADRMLYVRAWRRAAPLAPIERVDALRRWTHERLDLSCSPASSDPAEVLHGGHADSAGMTLVLGEALAREGYAPRWVSMLARDHPCGCGPRLEARHEVIELALADHSVHVLDPMANVRFPCTLQALIDRPTLADGVDRERDAVYSVRRCDLFATSFWYGRVMAVAVRSRPRGARHFVLARWAEHAAQPHYRALTRGYSAARRILRRP